MIGLLDEDGYLREKTDELCGLLKIGEPRLNRILSLLKTLKPTGVFAQDLRECLLLQLMELHPENELARRLTGQLEALARGSTAALCKTLHCTADQLNEAIAAIRSCDPKPGRSQGAAAASLACEVAVEIEDGQFKITLTHSFSELIFNPLPIDDPSVQEYLKQKTTAAKNLLLAIQKRNQTLAAITEAICLNQKGFFMEGRPLMPLTRHQIASQLGLHPSTVSRSLAGKGLEFNGQLYPFSIFFSAKIQPANSRQIPGKTAHSRFPSPPPMGADRVKPQTFRKNLKTSRSFPFFSHLVKIINNLSSVLCYNKLTY